MVMFKTLPHFSQFFIVVSPGNFNNFFFLSILKVFLDVARMVAATATSSLVYFFFPLPPVTSMAAVAGFVLPDIMAELVMHFFPGAGEP